MSSHYRLMRTLIKTEYDVVQVRQRAKQISQLIGFAPQEQTRIATAVSEIARNAYQYAGGGVVDFLVEYSKLTPSVQCFFVQIKDSGSGIPRLKEILNGKYIPPSGGGLGLLGAKRLMDEFYINSSENLGTLIQLGTHLPISQSPFTAESVKKVSNELAVSSLANPYQELQMQNQELLRTLEELRKTQSKISDANRALSETNHELEETNRGVVALYTELDEKAEELKRANQIKSRFLSHMSHEFRTPINSIIGLSKLLLDHLDGDLTQEQDKQVRFINQSANDILDMVNDLLDLSKVEAGKTEVRRTEFHLATVFSRLKGLMRPLQIVSGTDLIFETRGEIPTLNTDVAKVEQILRNLISNALKFTDKGQVCVSAKHIEADRISISVQDTGIGISPENLGKIFEEFTQIDSPLQKRHKGTGLGLPLVKKFTTLLGGTINVTSQQGSGSVFTVILPRVFVPPHPPKDELDLETTLDPTRDPVLVIEDNRRTICQYREFLVGTSFQIIPARTVRDAKLLLEKFKPVAIIQDIFLSGEPLSWPFLVETRRDPSLKHIPVIIATAADEEKKAFDLGASAFGRKPLKRKWLVDWLYLLVKSTGVKALVIDDEEVSRYLLRNLLSETRYGVIEASTAEEGIRLARETKPTVIFLDYIMPKTDAFEVLKELRHIPETAKIPVIIHSSKIFTEFERLQLQKEAAAILPKETPSREIALARLREALIRAQNQNHFFDLERKHA